MEEPRGIEGLKTFQTKACTFSMFCLPKAPLFMTGSDLQFENKYCCGELQTEQRVETAVSPTSPRHQAELLARSWWWLPEIPGAIENGDVQQDKGISRSQLMVPVFSHHFCPCLSTWRKT